MTITGAIVLYAVFWFMGLLVALPLGLKTQGDVGADPDTPAYTPLNANVRRKMLWVTAIAFALWLPLTLLIASGWIGVEDVDIWGRMG